MPPVPHVCPPPTKQNSFKIQALNFTEDEEVFDDVTAEEYEKAVEECNAMEKKWRLFKKCVLFVFHILHCSHSLHPTSPPAANDTKHSLRLFAKTNF